ncbi:DNA adenine methylase [Burkholderia ubonensis]|uniref:DNA adenine methylase n=1 Tax=Burkholderia ubonensis TaxID=101571 RepID=UPI0011606C97|nr:DNA adenine methylase [Burkholderia ubonensis]
MIKITDNVPLIRLFDESDPTHAQWKRIGMLPTITGPDNQTWVSQGQFDRLSILTSSAFDWGNEPQLTDDLFAPAIITPLGSHTCVTAGAAAVRSSAEELWMQLLPLWVDRRTGNLCKQASSWQELDLREYRAYTLDVSLMERATQSRLRHQQLAASRSGLFARSANYMGSKAALAGQILDVVDAVASDGTTIVDLMCGSGAMAGAFSRHYPTIASDAQIFCRYLGLVQGGGMTLATGTVIAETVIRGARSRYESLSDEHRERIDEEDRLLNSELSPTVQDSVAASLQRRTLAWEHEHRGGIEAVTDAWRNGHLLSHLYSGLYFGERQGAELDCLRQAIDDLPEERDRRWALGALVCAASACAYTYGGHFAQPKLDIAPDGKRRGDLSEALKQRSLSVSHEFFVRLTRLAEESEHVKYPVEVMPGPWEVALQALKPNVEQRPMCVYVDPPYTRDEYSRYYHVLEAVVQYQPHSVSGKGRLPQRGSQGRFASPFSGRRPELIEREIAKVLYACLANGWTCLWSYSSSGTASIKGTLKHLSDVAHSIEIFQMNHVYKAQGKRNAKQVMEYAIYLQPRQ